MPDQTSTANIIHPTPAGYAEYEIDIERVLRSDLPIVLDRMPDRKSTRLNSSHG